MTIGLIGCGKMGSALIKGAVQASIIQPENLHLFDIHRESAQSLASELNAQISPSLKEIATVADTLLLCTKPNNIPEALKAMERPQNSGVTLETLQQHAIPTDRIVRAMPNTPALLGKGAIGYFGNQNVTSDDKNQLKALFNAVGISCEVNNEDLIDAVTALSGSGPAYFYTIIESLANGAIDLGLDQETALQLSIQTAIGAAEMLKQTGESPEELRRQVSSPGGTTLAGLAKLTEKDLQSTLKAGVQAAYDRAKELGRVG